MANPVGPRESTPRIALVVAMADNGVIGKGGGLPWHLPDDLKHFKAVTFGKPVLMGRRTFESIGKPLPGRRNLVMTRGAAAAVPGVEYVGSVEQARSLAAGAAELCVIGGAEVFALPTYTALLELRSELARRGHVGRFYEAASPR